MMKATFEMQAASLGHLIKVMEERTGEPSRVMLEPHDSVGHWTIVVGQTQAVMLVIGEVACAGEDCLRHASII